MNRPLIRELRLHCSVERAFEVFTSEIDAWWPPGHRRFEHSTLHLEARVGGRFFERAPAGDEVVLGEVLRCEPPRSIAYSWRPGALTEPTEVEVHFETHGDLTSVVIVHGEGRAALGDAWPSRVEIFDRSWREVLGAFVARVEQQIRQGRASA